MRCDYAGTFPVCISSCIVKKKEYSSARTPMQGRSFCILHSCDLAYAMAMSSNMQCGPEAKMLNTTEAYHARMILGQPLQILYCVLCNDHNSLRNADLMLTQPRVFSQSIYKTATISFQSPGF